jgi:hypothetical protein
MHDQKIKNAILKRIIIWFSLLPVLICFLGNSIANAQDNSANILKYVQDKYEHGYFNQVISILDSSLAHKVFNDPVNKDEAYALLARSYIALDYPDMAKKTVKKLLKLNKKYQPATPMDPEFQMLTRTIKEEQRSQRKKSNSKYWIMGGTAVVAAVSYLVFKPEEKMQPLPGPPIHPSGR